MPTTIDIKRKDAIAEIRKVDLEFLPNDILNEILTALYGQDRMWNFSFVPEYTYKRPHDFESYEDDYNYPEHKDKFEPPYPS